MKDAIIPYTLPEVDDHSFFFISQHISPVLEAKMHRHKAWELYFVTHGSGMRMTGDTVMAFSEGDVVLIPPSMPHYWQYSPESVNRDGEVTYLMVAFNHDFVEKCMAAFPELRNRLKNVVFPVEAWKYGKRSAALIKATLRKMCDMDDLERLCEMFRLLTVIFTTGDHALIGGPVKIDCDIRRVEQIVTYVMAHYVQDITLDEIAAHVGMNRSAFCTFFKRKKGITFSRFVTQYRLATACDLLRNSQKQVSEICFAVGFNDLPHFIRVFTSTYDMSPTKFRKNRNSGISM